MSTDHEDYGMDGMYMIKSRSLFFLLKVTRDLRVVGDYMVKVMPVPKEHSVDLPTILSTPCLLVFIRHRPDEKSGYIKYLKHQKSCSLMDTLPRGAGTQEMVLSVLSFCKEVFGVEVFSFFDAAVFTCNHNNSKVNLMYHNLLVHGKTWYERKFDATPRTDGHKLQLTKDTLSRVVDQDRAEDINMAIDRSSNVSRSLKEAFKVEIQSAIGNETWNQVFHRISYMENGCVFFAEDILSKIVSLLAIPNITSWQITISNQIVVSNLVAYEHILEGGR